MTVENKLKDMAVNTAIVLGTVILAYAGLRASPYYERHKKPEYTPVSEPATPTIQPLNFQRAQRNYILYIRSIPTSSPSPIPTSDR